jgi:hypothetical protein
MTTATAEILLAMLMFSPLLCLVYIIVSGVVEDYIST